MVSPDSRVRHRPRNSHLPSRIFLPAAADHGISACQAGFSIFTRSPPAPAAFFFSKPWANNTTKSSSAAGASIISSVGRRASRRPCVPARSRLPRRRLPLSLQMSARIAPVSLRLPRPNFLPQLQLQQPIQLPQAPQALRPAVLAISHQHNKVALNSNLLHLRQRYEILSLLNLLFVSMFTNRIKLNHQIRSDIIFTAKPPYKIINII